MIHLEAEILRSKRVALEVGHCLALSMGHEDLEGKLRDPSVLDQLTQVKLIIQHFVSFLHLAKQNNVAP